jgi:5,10-methylene-tetrahydrofolate dehydrogenase/methenyl tetrahydrofolate cyclohydrolase
MSGFRRVAPGRFVGDVDFDALKEVAHWVDQSRRHRPDDGPALMQNLIDAARYQLGLERARYSKE